MAIQSGVPLELCKEINQRVRGNNGVLLKAYPDATTQCYGLTEDALNIVVTRDGGTLVAGMGAGNVSLTSPPDVTNGSSPEWLVPPRVVPGAGGSGGSGGSGGATTSSLVITGVTDFGTVPNWTSPSTELTLTNPGTTAVSITDIVLQRVNTFDPLLDLSTFDCQEASVIAAASNTFFGDWRELISPTANAVQPGYTGDPDYLVNTYQGRVGPWTVPAGASCHIGVIWFVSANQSNWGDIGSAIATPLVVQTTAGNFSTTITGVVGN